MKWISLPIALVASLLFVSTAVAATTTIGSLRPAYSGPQGCTGCGWFQVGVSTGTLAAPADGTITEFRIRTGDAPSGTENVVPVVVRAVGGGQYEVVHRTPVWNLIGQAPQSIASLDVSLPVLAGDLIGAEYSTNNVSMGVGLSNATAGVDTQLTTDGSALNTAFTPTGSNNQGRLNLEAVLSTVDTPAPPTFTDTTAPIITQFKTAYKRWRYKPKGAVVSKRAHPGTTFSLNISEPASVQFNVSKAFRGKITKGVCKKAGRSNRKNRRCTKVIQVHQFTRQAFVGVNRWPYSARYLDGKGKVGTLRPGPYKLTAVATDASGNVSAPQTIGFTIVR